MQVLGIRLDRSVEERLERHAREIGRPKSVVARDWIVERLDRESVDGEMRRAAEILAQDASDGSQVKVDHAVTAWLRALDEEDGGYDWGPEGPPA